MKTIRKGVFETNSSSAHSLRIGSASKMFDTLEPARGDDAIIIRTDDYGWEWRRITDTYEKACYVATHIVEHGVGDIELFKTAIRAHTGYDVCVVSADGYIDHESVGIIDDYVNTEEGIINLIFNPGSVIFTGNDNEVAPPGFYVTEEEAVYIITVTDEDDRIIGKTYTLSDDEEDVRIALASIFCHINEYSDSGYCADGYWDTFFSCWDTKSDDSSYIDGNKIYLRKTKYDGNKYNVIETRVFKFDIKHNV